MKLKAVRTAQFRRDVKRCIKQRKNMTALIETMTILENGDCLADYEEYADHALTGDKKDIRECHLQGRKSDWLLLYVQKPDAVLYLGLGSHSELYDK